MYAYIGLAQYEQDLDNEYKERTGIMQGFERAQQEYESKLFDPYGDEDYETEEDEIAAYEDAMETKAYYMEDR